MTIDQMISIVAPLFKSDDAALRGAISRDAKGVANRAFSNMVHGWPHTPDSEERCLQRYRVDKLQNAMLYHELEDIAFHGSELHELRAWKESQLKVEASWDIQAVAKALGLPLGSDIRAAILPKIKELIDKLSNTI